MRWIHPNFKRQITEFAGYNDDCGPCANEICLACVQGRDPSTGNVNAIRQRDVNAGIFSRGQTVYNLLQDVESFETNSTAAALYPSSVEYDNPNCDDVMNHLRDALAVRNHACVLNLGNAQALPGNESGVEWHFVAVVGIDSNLGYLVANGDEVPQDGEPNWTTRSQMIAAKPVAIVEYIPKQSSGGSTMQFPSGWDQQGDGWLGPASPVDNKRYVVRGGILDFIMKNGIPLESGNRPIEDIHLDADGYYRQTWLETLIQWSSAYGGRNDWAGAVSIERQQQINDLQAKLNSVTAVRDQLQQQLDHLQSQPQPQPPSDPNTAKAIAAISALKEALA